MSKKVCAAMGMLFLAFWVSAGGLFAADISSRVDDVFAQDQVREDYGSVYIPIKSVFSELEQLGLPTQILLDKLKEGVAKKVTPQNLLNGIINEAGRIKQAASLLQKTRFPLENESQKIELYNNISLFLLGGFQERLVELLLSETRSESEPADVFRFLGTTLLKLKTIAALNEEQLSELSLALLHSSLNYTSYPIIVSLFVKAKFRRVSDEEMYTLVVNILRSGGGVLQIEEELGRRTRK
jgi:hypothetical protein